MAFALRADGTSKKGDDFEYPSRGRNLSTFAKNVLAYWLEHRQPKTLWTELPIGGFDIRSFDVGGQR